MGIGRREKEGKETSGRRSQDRPDTGQRGEWQLNEQREEINIDVEEREENIDVEPRRERARAGNEPTAAAPSQPDCPGGSKDAASWRALELRSDWHGRMGIGTREKEGKETSVTGSEDEPAQDKEENGIWMNSAKK